MQQNISFYYNLIFISTKYILILHSRIVNKKRYDTHTAFYHFISIYDNFNIVSEETTLPGTNIGNPIVTKELLETVI